MSEAQTPAKLPAKRFTFAQMVNHSNRLSMAADFVDSEHEREVILAASDFLRDMGWPRRVPLAAGALSGSGRISRSKSQPSARRGPEP